MKHKDGTKKLHMIGNAHLDPVWLWRWTEGFQETKATFRSALDRLSESEDFIFTQSSAANYEWVERSDPAMFNEIRARVQEGRWHIVGGFWTQPDCNIPSGESFVRQALYGQRYFMEKFGVTASVGYNVDSFGHAGTLPQILKKSGLHYYVFMRPMPGEKALPGHLFRWQSDDGSEVLTFRILFEYLTWGKEVDVHVRRCADEVHAPLNEAMVFYGVGNHGGGPTKENIESIRRLQAEDSGLELVFSHPLRFFREVEARQQDYPVVRGDLQHHASGCYAAHSAIKMWNRQTENALTTAEGFSAAALCVAAQPYPDFSRAWKNLLFNQFHDIMAGTSLESAYEDAQVQMYESLSIAQRHLNYALQAISWKIGIPAEDGTLPLVVFNPNAWAISACVEAEALQNAVEGALLLTDTGDEVAFQMIQPQATCNGRARMCFNAELPAMGYRVYRLCKDKGAAPAPAPAAKKKDAFAAENAWYRLEIDPKTGCIESLYDKQNDVQVFKGQAAVPAVMQDDSDTWAHDILRFLDCIGTFTPVRVQRVESGPVRTVLRVDSTWETSTLRQDFIVYADRPQVDVRVTVNWHDRHQLLKLLFPVNVNFPQGVYDAPYGCIEKEGNGEEEPMQNWVDVSGLVPGQDKGYLAGLAVLNSGKYSASISKNEIGLTVLRSPIYAHHTPHQPAPDGDYRYIDQGEQRFTYALLPHTGPFEDAPVAKAAWQLNREPMVLAESYHDGPLPMCMSMAEADSDHIVISAIKQAESGEGVIVRAYETAKKQGSAHLRLPAFGAEFCAEFLPGEIKTFHIAQNGDVSEVLMTEL